MRLFWRALLAFLVLPGIVAIAVPTFFAMTARRAGAPFHVIGLLPLLAGFGLLLWCVRDFYVAGKGTLAPWAPPTNLVTTGPYRYSRNPMYVAVTSMLFGWAVSFQSGPLALYALIVVLAFHLRVVFGEEPVLARTFGAQWEDYRSRVPRWLL
jgi:protein-S-isoprenylcysteine O-methyltransferase Ste14